MKISELQKLLTRAEAEYGDLKVNVLRRTDMINSDYFEINTANIVRSGDAERVEIGDPLSELGEPILHLDYVPPQLDEEEEF